MRTTNTLDHSTMRTLDHSADSLPFFDWKMSEGFLWIPSSLRLRDSVMRCEM